MAKQAPTSPGEPPSPGIPGLHMGPEGLHTVSGKAPDTQSLRSPRSRGAGGAGTSVSPHQRGLARQRTGARPRPAPRAPRPGLEGRREAAGATDPAGGRGRGRPGANPRGRARRGAEEKGCSGGAGPRWGRGPWPDSHSPPRSPPGPSSAAVPAPALPARVSSRGSTSREDARSCGEARTSGGCVASGA